MLKSHGKIDIFSSAFGKDSYSKIRTLLAVQAFGCKIVIDALNKFKSKDLDLFDPVVGESQCQARAIRIAQVFNAWQQEDSDLFRAFNQVQTYFSQIYETITAFCQKSKDDFTGELMQMGFKVNKQFTLRQLFNVLKVSLESNDIQPEVWAYIKFISLCYFNCCYQSEASSLDAYVFDCQRVSDELSQELLILDIEKVFKSGVQKTIAQLSQDFLLADMQALESFAWPDEPEWQELWPEIRQGAQELCLSDQYKISPAYFGLQILFKCTRINRTPVVVRVHNYSQEHFIRYYFYKVDENFELKLCLREEITGSAAIFIDGISYSGSFEDWQRDYKNEFDTFCKENRVLPPDAQTAQDDAAMIFANTGILKALELFYSTRPDYYGWAKSQVDWSLYPKILEKRRIQQDEASLLGCCYQNMSLFVSDHMYPLYIN